MKYFGKKVLLQTAIDYDMPAHGITAFLVTPLHSRQEELFAMKILAVLRNQLEIMQ